MLVKDTYLSNKYLAGLIGAILPVFPLSTTEAGDVCACYPKQLSILALSAK